MKRGISSVAVTAMLLALAGCDAGPQTLGWEGSTASEPEAFTVVWRPHITLSGRMDFHRSGVFFRLGSGCKIR